MVGQRLEGGRGRDRHHRGLFEREARRFAGQLVRAGHGVLRERPAADAVHLVPDLEPGHAGPDGGDCAGQVTPGYPVLRPPEAEAGDPHQVGLAGHQVPGAAVQARRVHPDQDLVVGDLGRGMRVRRRTSAAPYRSWTTARMSGVSVGRDWVGCLVS